MWEKLLNSKHFLLLCASTAVLFLTVSIFIGISAYQSARAQTIPAGCVAISTGTAGLVVSNGMETTGITVADFTCPAGSSGMLTGVYKASTNPTQYYYVCVSTGT